MRNLDRIREIQYADTWNSWNLVNKGKTEPHLPTNTKQAHSIVITGYVVDSYSMSAGL